MVFLTVFRLRFNLRGRGKKLPEKRCKVRLANALKSGKALKA